MTLRSIYRILAGIMTMTSAFYASAQSDFREAGVLVEEFMVNNGGRYDIDNGLTSSHITCIERDSSGMVWLGTNDGVNAFDGYGFRSYVTEHDDSASTRGKRVSAIKNIDKYTMFMTFADGGLSYYDRRNNQFHSVEIDDAPENMGEFRSAYGICRMGDYAYVAYENNIIRIDLNTDDQLKIVMPSRKKYTGSYIEKINLEPMPDGRNIVMMLSRTTLGVLDTKTNKIKTIRMRKGYLNDICAKDSSHVYLATTKGLRVFDVSTSAITQGEILGDELVRTITKDYGLGFWIAYKNNHLIKWVPSNSKVRLVTNITSYVNSQTAIVDILEDENQVLWLATSNSGLVKLDAKRPKIRNVEVVNSGMPLNYITRDLFASKKYEVWAACGIDGVLKIDTKNKTAEHIDVPHRNVYSVYVRKSGEVIFGTSMGPMTYDKTTGKIESIEVSDSILASIGGRCIINAICEDCLGNLWFATQIGVYRYNGAVPKYYPSASHGMENVNTVYEDSEGRIWAGTVSGSFVMDVGDTIFTETKAGRINLGDNNNTTSFADYKNMVLMGTASGVLAYNKDTREVQTAHLSHHFDKTMIYSIVTDSNNAIWLSSNRGVGYLAEGSNLAYVFNHYDGLALQGNECHKLTKFANNIYTGDATNLNFIPADRLKFNDIQPNVFVSAVEYGQSGKEEGAMMENDTLYSVRYLLRASLKLHVASSDFTVPSRNEFKYKIDNEDWVHLTGSNEILISGPGPGTYRVEIMATNSDMTWSENTHTVYIKIVPPLWLSNAALIFYTIMLFTLTWFLMNLRFRTMKKHMRQMENEAKAKKLVEAQRNRLAKLHKDQEDSIRYAKRIQESLMPPVGSFDKLFNKIFVYYMPRDIVSGDFYSFYERDDKTFIIAADCTGHGVPGAFISILGVDHLYNIIMKQKVDDAGAILTYLHRDLHSTVFKRDNSDEEFNEGMDLTICVVYHKERKINFAGAMNDLYLIRDNEILTYHGDRHSIGTNNTLGDVDDRQYSSQIIHCQPGDMFYMFSDGFVDQFGGPEYKKFKHRRFKQLLLYLHKLPARDQKNMLNRRFAEWKGNNEQTDDVSVIGFEPWA